MRGLIRWGLVRGVSRGVMALRVMLSVMALTTGGLVVGASDASARPKCEEGLKQGSSTGEGTWRVERVSGAAPSGRSAPAAAAVGRWIYVFGGSHDDVVTGEVTLHDDFHRFDTVKKHWRTVSTAGNRPAARAFSSMVNDPHSQRLVMYGGATFGDFFGDFVALGDLWTFDLDTDAWTMLDAVNSGPGGRSGATLWIDAGELYVFGGIDSYFQTHNDLWSFQFATQSWTEWIPDGDSAAPPPRHEALSGSVVRLGKLTLYGGETVTEDFNFVTLPDTWQYDVATRTWQELTPSAQFDIDPPRNLGAAALLGDALYVHGGDIPGGELCGAVFAQNPTDELWRFNLQTERWQQVVPGGADVARLKRSRGVEVRGVMYVLGGYDFTCKDGIGIQIWNEDVYSYQPARRHRRR